MAGLSMKRRCGWIPAALETPPRVVWARKEVATDTCPKSLITGQSVTWMEEFLVWRRLGQALPDTADARTVEAFLILQEETTREINHAT